MKWMGLNELRTSFLQFFKEKGHTILPSFGLVPQDDKSLLLINSGMAPMKKFFLGQEIPPSKRVATCQKCIRTPDIERVGKTSRHGTFFEMLGNFSFGDYFKKEVTSWAWEYITKILQISVEKLWISIYENDNEAFDIWVNQVGVDPNRIVRLGKDDNFWEIGAGPCGPCSEIYFDRGEEYGCDSPNCGVGCDCDRYVEFWNLVFSQFDSDGNGNYIEMAHPNIDTGMGLERIACIMQGTDSIFEIDTIKNIINKISKLANVTYGENDKTDMSLRVITDHIRSTVFMIGDGVLPSNEGRGYVLRRLLRRAARHGKLLGISGQFLFEVCDAVIDENKDSYSELYNNRDYIKKVIQIEEERFLKTINQGMERLKDLINEIKLSGKNILNGESAFKLYDTFGFPIDLTKEIAGEYNVNVDETEFQMLMEQQRERARKARHNQDDCGWINDKDSLIDIEKTKFVGYELSEIESKIVAIIGEKDKNKLIIVLNKTPFYAQSGGQIGDKGLIKYENGMIEIIDTTKDNNGHILHHGVLINGDMPLIGEKVMASIDIDKRTLIERNHTSCHLLQAALKNILGEHVNQAGSYVDEEKLRFDFTHFHPVTADELKSVEKEINEIILKGLDVKKSEMNIQEAKKLGAMALFGEKYGKIVRVCNIDGYSIELCGGTHISNTSEIGIFKISSESSVAAGVRRIEAVTSMGVLNLLNSINQKCILVGNNLRAGSLDEVVSKSGLIMQQIKNYERQIGELESQIVYSKISNLISKKYEINEIKIVTHCFDDIKADILKTIADKLKSQDENLLSILTGKTADNKFSIVVSCGKSLISKGINAGKVVKNICEKFNGKGGGRPDLAMGGVGYQINNDDINGVLKGILTDKK